MKRIFSVFVAALFAVLVNSAYAKVDPNGPPDVLVKSVVSDLLVVIKSDKDIQSGDRKRMIEVIETVVSPHIAFERSTALAVGKYWRRATPLEQAVLTREFHSLIVSTYSLLMMDQRTAEIVYLPFRLPANAVDATVRIQVKREHGPPLQMDFGLSKTTLGWKMNDVVVEGVSMVTVYRDEFGAEITRSGTKGLIRKLSEKNKTLSAEIEKTHKKTATK